MPRHNYDLLNLNTEKLFEEKNVDEIIRIEKIIEAEIEKKRLDLRSMVGDRYKDVLTASDEIIHMKTISEEIVSNIKDITDLCSKLVSQKCKEVPKPPPTDQKVIEERMIGIQVRLLFILTDHIWLALDKEDHSTAAQYYLLAQYIHTGFKLAKQEYLDRLLILSRLHRNIEDLRERILKKVKEKLQKVELDAQDVGNNLTALILLENQNSTDLLHTFIEHRKIALNTVINSPHPTVRKQISAMVRCLTATIHLLHDCFTFSGGERKGLIWQQLDDIIGDKALPVMKKVEMPSTPLAVYISDAIKEFRPHCNNNVSVPKETEVKNLIQEWLQLTALSIESGLEKSLELVTNLKGLYLIREEALKIEIPEDWEQICIQTSLPEKFNVWYYFFQNLISKRAEILISNKLAAVNQYLEAEIKNGLNDNCQNAVECSLWLEESEDVSRHENNHLGLSMKTKGLSKGILDMCLKVDSKYCELLEDLSSYVYGNINSTTNIIQPNTLIDRKYADKSKLEAHLRSECAKNTEQLSNFIDKYLRSQIHSPTFVAKSVMSARFLQGLTTLCPNFNRCCSLGGSTNEWTKVGQTFKQSNLKFWRYWVNDAVNKVDKVAEGCLQRVGVEEMLGMYLKWETIEIQEQAEEKVFKSQIKVPSQPSVPMDAILGELQANMSSVLPHSIPKQIHIEYIEGGVVKVLERYLNAAENIQNQTQALQFLFDVKFLATFCVPRENFQLLGKYQEICAKIRTNVDPFDMDVFHTYLQENVKRCALQSQVILGCLLPSSGQLASLGVPEKSKEQEKDPCLIALSTPAVNGWFPLLPVTAPAQKVPMSHRKEVKSVSKQVKVAPKKPLDGASSVRAGAAALFGGLTTDWFS